jgi:hypothetical protein
MQSEIESRRKLHADLKVRLEREQLTQAADMASLSPIMSRRFAMRMQMPNWKRAASFQSWT